ncbi:hypothetical protein NKG05_14325 [Oerskovia sp. M15]
MVVDPEDPAVVMAQKDLDRMLVGGDVVRDRTMTVGGAVWTAVSGLVLWAVLARGGARRRAVAAR